MTEFHVYLYGPKAGPLPTSFEEVSTRLARLDRLHQEPDGAFVWSPSRNENVFGMIYDAVDRVQYVELRGHLSFASWRQLIDNIDAGGSLEIVIMCLLNQELQDLQSFEQSIWIANEA